MGNSKYLDGLNTDEKAALGKKLWGIQNHKCFICGEEIDLDIQKTNIDHIRPLANGGKDDPINFAITHEHCNKSKQDADLEVAKKLYQLSKIILGAEITKETPSLKHVLAANNGSKYSFKYKLDGSQIIYSFDEIGDTTIYKTEVFTDNLSGEKTAFINVPLEYIYHDDVINPRGINKSISLLIKEFHKPNPQLHLSLARLDGDKIRIFDGQHKAVAQIMLGVKSIVMRLFISPDVERLIETNTNAGSKLKQIAFDKAIVRQLHDTLYTERLKKYQVDHCLDEDNYSFSEQNLVDYFKGERGNIRVYIINSQKNAITRSPDNKLQSYINFEGRGTQLPLSYSTFEKTFLATFINAKTILTTPINYRVEEGSNPRILEKEQLIRLCNIISEELLIGKYDSEIGTHRIENNIGEGRGDTIPDDHLIAYRLCKEEIMYNWVQYLKLLIKNHFAFAGTKYNEENLFQQKLPDQLWDNIQMFIINLRELPIWKDRSMSLTIFGGKNNYDFWDTVFQTARTPDGTAVLAKPLNVAEMISR
ncbi:MAG: HNH endonuclease [Spirochaetia bacterium]|nr:HNH endonuclease [Spirochaetia bacterium]